MEKIKIFCLPSHQAAAHTSGVDFARIIQPMQQLGQVVGFDVHVWDIKEDLRWDDVAQDYDIIYFNYLNNPWGFAAMGSMARKYGVQLVMDIDDNLWNIQTDNTAYEIFKKGSEGIKTITSICNEVDAVTTTNGYLKNLIAHNTLKRHENIQVFPNYINLSLYNHIAKDKNTLEINIGHFGSTTHFKDLAEDQFRLGMDRIMQEYPNVVFTTIGAFLPTYRDRWGQRYIQKFGSIDIYEWINKVYPVYADEIDFYVVPLVDTVYNKCKSEIKYMEISSTKRPGCYQNIRQYDDVIRHGINGFLCTTKEDWYTSMKKLIDDAVLRKSMGVEAYKTAQGHTIQGHIKEYADFFRKIIDKRNNK